jgi:hypothetical protein
MDRAMMTSLVARARRGRLRCPARRSAKGATPGTTLRPLPPERPSRNRGWRIHGDRRVWGLWILCASSTTRRGLTRGQRALRLEASRRVRRSSRAGNARGGAAGVQALVLTVDVDTRLRVSENGDPRARLSSLRPNPVWSQTAHEGRLRQTISFRHAGLLSDACLVMEAARPHGFTLKCASPGRWRTRVTRTAFNAIQAMAAHPALRALPLPVPEEGVGGRGVITEEAGARSYRRRSNANSALARTTRPPTSSRG